MKNFKKSTVQRLACLFLIAGMQATAYAQVSVNCQGVATASQNAKDKKLNRIATAKTNSDNVNKAAADCLAALTTLVTSSIPSGSINDLPSIDIGRIISHMAKQTCAVILAEANKIKQSVDGTVNGAVGGINGAIGSVLDGVTQRNGIWYGADGLRLPDGTPYKFIGVNGSIINSVTDSYGNINPSLLSSPINQAASTAVVNQNTAVTKSPVIQSERAASVSGNSIWDKFGCAFSGGAGCN